MPTPTVSGNMERSIAEHERACLVLIENEQERIAPDNHLISTLCDSVRLAREYAGFMCALATRAALAVLPAALEPERDWRATWDIEGKAQYCVCESEKIARESAIHVGGRVEYCLDDDIWLCAECNKKKCECK